MPIIPHIPLSLRIQTERVATCRSVLGASWVVSVNGNVGDVAVMVYNWVRAVPSVVHQADDVRSLGAVLSVVTFGFLHINK